MHTDYEDGIPVGKYILGDDMEFKHVLYNHWVITIKTQPVEDSAHMRIVGFEVEPRSYAVGESPTTEYHNHPLLYIEDLAKEEEGDVKGEKRTFAFTYSVQTVTDTETAWTMRMEHYLKIGNQKIHYAAIFLSLGIILGLLCIISAAVKRGLNTDLLKIAKNQLSKTQRRQERARLPPAEDEAENRSLTKKKPVVSAEDVAWKKCHGDVFRTPGFPNILACLLGAGAQLTAMFFTLLLAIIFAFANTQWRPYIYTTSMVILALFGFLNGYVTSRSLKFFGTTDWNFSATVSALVLPLFITGAFLFEVFFAWMSKSALRFSMKSILMRVLGWYLLNGTMCYYGAFKGYV